MRLLFSFFALVLGSAFGAEALKFPERVTRQAGTVAIEYSVGDEAFAEALAVKLPDFRLPPFPNEQANADLLQHRAVYLARIYHLLAIKKDPKMDSLFNAVAGFFSYDLPPPTRCALWRKIELIERLKAGKNVEGFKLGGPTGLDFSLNFPRIENVDDSEEIRDWRGKMQAYWASFQMPIQIGKQALPVDDIDAGLKQTGDIIAMFRGGPGPFVVLHEVTELAIVSKYLTSPDRRWFCDGVANYIAAKALAEQLGPERARQYYNLDEQLRRFAPQAASVDLEKWPAVEAMNPGAYDEDLNTANYAFATQAITAACAEQDDTLLPRLFTEIGKTPREKATMKTVYAAFIRITGQDLRSYLPKPKKSQRNSKRK